MITIIKINKDEVQWLRNNHNIKFGYGGLSKTVASGRKATYYLTESRYNLKLHNKYQESLIAK